MAISSVLIAFSVVALDQINAQQPQVTSVECNFVDEVNIDITDGNNFFSDWIDQDKKEFRGIMTDTNCPGGQQVFENVAVAAHGDAGNYRLTFNGFTCDQPKTSLEDYTKEDVAFVIQRVQEHPFMAGEVMRVGSVSLAFTCKIKVQDELEVLIGTVQDDVDPIGQQTFQTAFELMQTTDSTGEEQTNINGDSNVDIGQELFFKARGTNVAGLEYMPVSVKVEKEGCDSPACRWTFYDFTESRSGDDQGSCQFPGLDFAVSRLSDGVMIQYKAFTLQDQGDAEDYRYKIKVTMQYCIAGQEDSACTKAKELCGVTTYPPLILTAAQTISYAGDRTIVLPKSLTDAWIQISIPSDKDLIIDVVDLDLTENCNQIPSDTFQMLGFNNDSDTRWKPCDPNYDMDQPLRVGDVHMGEGMRIDVLDFSIGYKGESGSDSFVMDLRFVDNEAPST